MTKFVSYSEDTESGYSFSYDDTNGFEGVDGLATVNLNDLEKFSNELQKFIKAIRKDQSK